jgi:hypothetical protein
MLDHNEQANRQRESNEPNVLAGPMTAKADRHAKSRKAYQKRRIRAMTSALNNRKLVNPEVRPSLANWKPLKAIVPGNLIAINALQKAGMPFEVSKTEYFSNDRWKVLLNVGTGVAPALHISIMAQDLNSEPTWAECQAIKNQLLGNDQEMVQLYPAEKRLVNAAPIYHLWGIKGMPVPLGMGLENVIPPRASGEAALQIDGDSTA